MSRIIKRSNSDLTGIEIIMKNTAYRPLPTHNCTEHGHVLMPQREEFCYICDICNTTVTITTDYQPSDYDKGRVTEEMISETILKALVFTNENSEAWADGLARDIAALFRGGAK